MKKLVNLWRELDPSMKALVLIAIICLIGIILRWDYVISGIKKGFNFYNGDAD